MSGPDREEWRNAVPADYFRAPSPARIWDYWLGGKDNYPVDQAAGDEFIRKYPEILDIARQTRQFLIRVVRHLAGEAGVRQFLDIGTGLPTVQNTHEVAQAVAPDSKIVYVDHDPIVLAHARALLTNTTPEGVTTYVHADVHNPEQILADAHNVLNFGQPVAIMLLGILSHATDSAAQRREITDRLLAGAAPGSYLIMLDGIDTGDERFRESCAKRNYHLPTMAEFNACFEGMQLVEPGIVPANYWRPAPIEVGGTPPPVACYAGVGRTVV